ncbi:hypothetical protein BHE74_00029867 [Ensete ventricosum]|nr:hypothetical protein BHE74_00029867 [Ensete ventricosum]
MVHVKALVANGVQATWASKSSVTNERGPRQEISKAPSICDPQVREMTDRETPAVVQQNRAARLTTETCRFPSCSLSKAPPTPAHPSRIPPPQAPTSALDSAVIPAALLNEPFASLVIAIVFALSETPLLSYCSASADPLDSCSSLRHLDLALKTFIPLLCSLK